MLFGTTLVIQISKAKQAPMDEKSQIQAIKPFMGAFDNIGDNMFTETGQIVEIKNGLAAIQLTQGEQCSTCAVKGACSPLGSGARIIHTPVDPSFHAGDRIELAFEPSTRIASAAIVFLTPVFFMIAGLAVAAIVFGDAEKPAIIGSFGGLFVGFFLVWLVNKIVSKKRTFAPILRKI